MQPWLRTKCLPAPPANVSPSHGPVCPLLLHPPSLISLNRFPPLDPQWEHGPGAPMSYPTAPQLPPTQLTRSTQREKPFPCLHPILLVYPHKVQSPFTDLELSYLWKGPSVSSQALSSTSPLGQPPAPQASLQGERWLRRDKVQQEAGNGIGKERKRQPQAPVSTGFPCPHGA